MNIRSIGIEGFLSIGEATVNLDRKGVTLVEGLNHDSTADSNGAGKSSIFEALHFGLFGVTRRGLTGDDIINRHTKTGTTVKIEFESRGISYSIRRARKSKEHRYASGLWLWNDDTTEELTKGTIKDTQALIEEIIGLNMLAFQKTAYFGQGDVKPIAELTDAELKAVFEQGLGLSQVPIDAQKVSGYRKALESSMTGKLSDHKASKMMLEVSQASLEEKREAVRGFKETRDSHLKNLTKLLDFTKIQIEEAKKGSDSCSVQITSCGEEYSRLYGKYEAMTEMKSKFSDKMAEVMGKVARYTAIIPRLINEESSLLEEIDKVKVRSGSECESCGLVMGEKEVRKSVSVIDGKRKVVAGSLIDHNSQYDSIKVERGKMEGIIGPFQAKMDDLAVECKKTNDLRHAMTAKKASFDTQLTLKNDELKRIIADITAVKENDGSELTMAMNKASDTVDAYAKKVDSLEEEVNDATSKHETAKQLESALSNAGLKSLVFDKVTPTLNEMANDYLTILDPGMSVEISTVSTLKTGEKREKFSVTVETDTGAKVFQGHSGGEKQKVNLAVSLAFNKLMRSSSLNTPNLLILDEPFESLDAGSSDQVMELLSSLDVENVWLISHNQSVKDLIPNRIMAEKRDGITTIV